ncbi:MAG: hypothetical protein WBC85_04900 [Planktotalea sp.]
MLNPRHFLRMARWARRPPSEKRVKLVILVILICGGLFLIERYVGWPAALTPNSFRF